VDACQHGPRLHDLMPPPGKYEIVDPLASAAPGDQVASAIPYRAVRNNQGYTSGLVPAKKQLQGNVPGICMCLGNPLQTLDPPRHPQGHGHGHGCSSAPSYVTSPPTQYRCHSRPSSVHYTTLQEHGQSRQRPHGRVHTRHARRVCMLVRLYISALPPIDSVVVWFSPLQVSSPSTVGFFSPQNNCDYFPYFFLSRSYKSLAILGSAYHSLPTLVLY
jgi:hypothetical protein